MKKTFKSSVCLLLLTVLLAGTFVSCADKKTEEQSTETTVAAQTTVAETTAEDTLYDEDGYERDFVGDFDFNKDFTIFYWDDAPYVEFNTEGETGATVSDANYKRNVKVEERCGVKLKYIGTPGGSANRTAFVAKLKSLLSTDDAAVDIVGAYSMAAGIATIDGLYMDLYNCNNFEWDKPWWPESLKTMCTVNGKLYFTSGDISLNSILSMFAIFFNKSMLSDRNLENPYTLYENKQWTLDKMWEMSKDVNQDTDSSGSLNLGDTFGIISYKSGLDSYILSAGVTFLKNDGSSLEISEDFTGEIGDSIIAKLHSIYDDTTAAYFKSDDAAQVREAFGAGQAMFFADSAVGATMFNNAELSYGIVPMPLITENQDKYYTPTSFSITFFSIPYTQQDTNCASAVMEIMASESYRSTSPALYEQDLKCRYAQDEKAAQIYDEIRKNVIYDLGRVFSQNFEHPYNSTRAAIKDGSGWAALMKGKKKGWETQLEKLLEACG